MQFQSTALVSIFRQVQSLLTCNRCIIWFKLESIQLNR